MSVLINFKICDNAKECNGIAACPIKAFYWDEENKTIAVDNSKCTSCGLCEESCPVHAIRVAKNEEEYNKIKKEIDEDSRKISDLFVDRFGATSVDPASLIPVSEFKTQILESTKLAAAELFKNSSIKCLLYSIPIRELFKGVDVKFRKINVGDDESLLKTYEITKLPSLLFFKDGKLIGKIEGYHGNKDEEMIIEKIKEIIKNEV